MEQLGHRFERFHVDGEARVHLGDSHQHQHIHLTSGTQRCTSSRKVLSLTYNPSERPETPSLPFSNVPFPRDPDFVKRGSLSDEIHDRLSTPGARLALYGLSGVG